MTIAASTILARKAVQRWKTHQRPGYIDCAALLADIWEAKSDLEVQKLMSDQAIDFLRHDNLGVAKKYGRKTMLAYHTYVENLVEKKFGPTSVLKDYSYNSFRGFKDQSDIKDYARKVMQITVDRVLHCL